MHFTYQDIDNMLTTSLHIAINDVYPNIQSTVEVEVDNNLPFLDVLVTHEQTGFSTSLFRKKTFTGLCTDFGRLAPAKFEINLVRILVFPFYI